MLKGQAREDFEKWIEEPIQEHGRFGQLVTNIFDNIPFNMQYGILVDWFDSVGIDLNVKSWIERGVNCWLYSVGESFRPSSYINNDNQPTRTQARQKAIEQANKIYNDRK